MTPKKYSTQEIRDSLFIYDHYWVEASEIEELKKENDRLRFALTTVSAYAGEKRLRFIKTIADEALEGK